MYRDGKQQEAKDQTLGSAVIESPGAEEETLKIH